MTFMDKKERPRTKRLERPTPNLKHPVIGNKKSKEINSQLKECIEGIDKCKTSVDNGPDIRDRNAKTYKQILLNDVLDEKSPKRNKMNPKRESTDKTNLKDDTGLKNARKGPNKEASDEKPTTSSTTSQQDCGKSEATEQNDCIGWQRFNAQLQPCPHCCRTFFPHRLPVHERSCRGMASKKGAKKVQELKATVTTSPVIKSMFLECSTCSRKYSTTSLTLHELKCRANCNRRLSAGQSENPNELVTAWDQFKSQLVACGKCNRKFLADRLDKHEPICKASPLKIDAK